MILACPKLISPKTLCWKIRFWHLRNFVVAKISAKIFTEKVLAKFKDEFNESKFHSYIQKNLFPLKQQRKSKKIAYHLNFIELHR